MNRGSCQAKIYELTFLKHIRQRSSTKHSLHLIAKCISLSDLTLTMPDKLSDIVRSNQSARCIIHDFYKIPVDLVLYHKIKTIVLTVAYKLWPGIQ